MGLLNPSPRHERVCQYGYCNERASVRVQAVNSKTADSIDVNVCDDHYGSIGWRGWRLWRVTPVPPPTDTFTYPARE